MAVKKMLKKSFKKSRKPRARMTTSRRRLTPGLAVAGAGLYVARKGYNAYQNYKAGIRQAQKRAFNKSKATYANRLAASDNITSLKAISIGKPKKPSFSEKVDRINNPPVIYKRNYSFSSECTSGRKGWFQIPINHFDTGYAGGSLYDDSINSFNRLSSNTTSGDPTVISGGQTTRQRTYVEYLSQYLRILNSGTNPVTGTINLIGYKRDMDGFFANQSTPNTPINLMMLSSTNNLTAITSQEATVGNGFAFDAVTSGVNYTANYVMPGSTVNSAGATAQTDPHLNLFSSHIKEFMGFHFKCLSKTSFSLKPGQQVNQFLKINDSPLIKREHLESFYLKGISYFLVIEFEAGIVGSSIANNVISTGSGQLSCILEEKRLIGLSGRLKSKLVMPTAPLAGILAANQVTINPDTGIQDTGYEEDA